MYSSVLYQRHSTSADSALSVVHNSTAHKIYYTIVHYYTVHYCTLPMHSAVSTEQEQATPFSPREQPHLAPLDTFSFTPSPAHNIPSNLIGRIITLSRSSPTALWPTLLCSLSRGAPRLSRNPPHPILDIPALHCTALSHPVQSRQQYTFQINPPPPSTEFPSPPEH